MPGRSTSATAGPFVMVVDGLGHGLRRRTRPREARRVLPEQTALEPAEIMQAAARRSAEHAGRRAGGRPVGRRARRGPVRGRRQHRRRHPGQPHGETTSMVSHNGTVGHTIRKVQEFNYPWSAESVLLMHSDGLATHWHLGRYPGLCPTTPGLIAGVLYRDHSAAVTT